MSLPLFVIISLTTLFSGLCYFSSERFDLYLMSMLLKIERLFKKLRQLFDIKNGGDSKKFIFRLEEIYRNQVFLKKKISTDQIPHYKYYSAILIEIIDLQNHFGISIQRPLRSLRQAVMSERQFEIQNLSIIRNQLLKITIGSVFIFALTLFAENILEKQCWPLNGLLLVIQTSGLFISHHILKKIAFRGNYPFQVLCQVLFKIDIFSSVMISSSSLLQKIGAQSLEQISEISEYQFLVEGIRNLMDNWANEGQGPSALLPFYLEEVHWLQKDNLNNLQHKLTTVSFVLLAIFVFVPYMLVVLFFLFTQFSL